MMSQVVEKWICTYKPYQLFSFHVITKHDPFLTRKIQRLTGSAVSNRLVTDTHRHVADTSQQLGILSKFVGCRCHVVVVVCEQANVK
jgi:hypothetical protein